MKSSRLALLLFTFVSPCVASVAIDTTRLPNGTVQAAYSAVIHVSGGCTPYSWAIVSGALPAGVRKKASSDTSSLDLTGAPTTAGSYSFTVSVKGCGGHVDKESYKVVIQPASKRVVDLSWKPSTSKDLAGYNVYRSSGGSAWKKINASLTAWTQYSDSSVADDTTYYYAATAVNIEGRESPRTAAVKVVIP
jgi:Putative Ig domain